MPMPGDLLGWAALFGLIGLAAAGAQIFALPGAKHPFIAQVSGPICGVAFGAAIVLVLLGRVP